jgi:hypothetical protein
VALLLLSDGVGVEVLIWEQEARVVEGGLLNWMRVCVVLLCGLIAS